MVHECRDDRRRGSRRADRRLRTGAGRTLGDPGRRRVLPAAVWPVRHFWVGERGDAGRFEEAKLASVATTIPYGFAAGFLGGAIAEPGPVAVVLGKARGWSPPTLRAMLIRFFLPVQILSLARFNAEGLLSADIVAQGAAALPLVLAASAAGTTSTGRSTPRLLVMSSAASSPGWGCSACRRRTRTFWRGPRRARRPSAVVSKAGRFISVFRRRGDGLPGARLPGDALRNRVG